MVQIYLLVASQNSYSLLWISVQSLSLGGFSWLVVVCLFVLVSTHLTDLAENCFSHV